MNDTLPLVRQRQVDELREKLRGCRSSGQFGARIIYDGISMRRSGPGLVATTVLISVCVAGCASATRQQRPRAGRLTVGVTATGASASTLTLKIVVESTAIGGSVKADAGVFTSDDVPFGTHVVRLTGVPSACRVDNGAERKITITEQRRSAVLRYDVRCD